MRDAPGVVDRGETLVGGLGTCGEGTMPVLCTLTCLAVDVVWATRPACLCVRWGRIACLTPTVMTGSRLNPKATPPDLGDEGIDCAPAPNPKPPKQAN